MEELAEFRVILVKEAGMAICTVAKEVLEDMDAPGGRVVLVAVVAVE